MSAGVLGIIFFYLSPDYHYKGNDNITSENFVIVAIGEHSFFDYNLFENPDKSLNLESDFFSDSDYPFFPHTAKTIWDSSLVYEIRSTSPFAIGMMILCVFLFILVLNKPMKIQKVLDKITHYIERQRFQGIPKPDFSNIVSAPLGIGIEGRTGIIGVRSWSVNKNGILKSIVQGTEWDNAELYADKTPDKEGVKGVYAYRLGANLKQTSTVMGIVELKGQYEFHAEGVIRAEYCKIIGLFISKGYQRLGKFLSNKYNIPVYFNDNPQIAYLEWLYCEQGQKGLCHNFEILKGE